MLKAYLQSKTSTAVAVSDTSTLPLSLSITLKHCLNVIIPWHTMSVLFERERERESMGKRQTGIEGGR